MGSCQDEVFYQRYLDPNKCMKVHKGCGHQCHGVIGETTCLPCLDSACQLLTELNQSGDRLCPICYNSELQYKACVQLDCGHIFHADCILNRLKNRHRTLQIDFEFMACPTCDAEISETRCHAIVNELKALHI